MHTACLHCREERPLDGRHSSQRGTVDGGLVHQIDYHTQPKTAGWNHVLFVLLHLLYCNILQVLAHKTHDFSD